ncbi:META domain-containing protein [Streptomyces sp. NPDC001606]
MNRYKQHLASATATLLLPLTLACAGNPAHSGAVTSQAIPREPVTGVEWRVESLTADGTTRPAPATARLRIDADGRAAGNLGCNGFSAEATVHGDRVTFGGLRTTRMACDPARMTFERALARTLAGHTLTAARDHDRLVLTTRDGDLVRLVRTTAE